MEASFAAEPEKQELTVTCVFEAPPSLLWKAYTDPKLIPQWLGPKLFTNLVDHMDVRPGGTWRFVHRDTDGVEYAFRGIYHLVDEPNQLVYTLEFEDLPGHILLDTVTFKDLGDGKTLLTDQSVFQSVRDRDGMIQGGMESAARDSMDRLTELIKNVPKA
jgi:uncharacterized protein YndB with AHSA1/START domain